jgi:hypothetical protein
MNEFSLERHYKLWEQNNTLIKRVVFLSLVLAIALLVKVLTPFVAHSGEKSPTLERIEALETRQASENDKLRTIKRTESVLKDVNRFIASQPWQREKEQLIDRYQGMRSGHDRESYQAEADQAIRNIAGMLRENVLSPLRESAGVREAGERRLARPGLRDVRGANPERLEAEIESLNGFIEGWQAEYTGKRWYETISMKEMAMSDLSRDLNRQLDSFSRIVRQELAAVEQARNEVQEELKTLASEIGEEAARLDEIEKELESILPQWMRGLVETRQVIQLLPALLLGAAAYVLVIGVTLTNHFRHYVLGKQLEQTVTGDPAMSSTWTLIPRGRLGTAQTVAAYTLFFLASWWMFEWSLDLLQAWLAIDDSQAWIASASLWNSFRWLSRLVFAGLIACAWLIPWRAERELKAR